MVVTSRGGVGCCWVKSLLKLADYNVRPQVPPKSLTRFTQARESGKKLTFGLTPRGRDITRR